MNAGPRPTCCETDSIAVVARAILSTRADAIAIVDAQHRSRTVVTAYDILAWVIAGGDVMQSIGTAIGSAPQIVGPDASVSDAVLAMGTAHAAALVLTEDGTPTAPRHGASIRSSDGDCADRGRVLI